MRRLAQLELAVVGLAAVLRVAAGVSIGRTRFADHPLVDAYTYWTQALALSAGQDPFAEGFYQPPAYPVILSWLGELTGRPELGVTRAVQLGLGVAVTWGVVVLGRKLGSRMGAPWAGVVAGLLYALYPTPLLFELDLLTPAVSTACLVAGLWLVWPGLDATAPVRGWRMGLGGLALGAAVAVHPTYLLVGLVLAAGVGRAAPVRAAALCVGLALPLLPTAVHNARTQDAPALVSYNGGINFYLGNNPDWRTTAFLRPGLPFRQLALEADPATRDLPARNRYWRQRTFDEIADHPDAWLAALVTKAYWSVHDTEIPRNEDYRCRTDDGPLAWIGRLPVRYGWVFPLAVLGAAAAVRRAGPAGRVWVGCWVALHLPLVLFLPTDRYRLATWPVVSVLAAVGVVAAHQAWRKAQADGTRPPRSWALLLPVVVLPWLPIDARTQVDQAWCHHVDANLAYMDQDYALAERLYAATVALDPDDLGAWSFLAACLEKRKDHAGAAQAMEPVLRAFPDHYPSLMTASRLEQRQGRHSQAADLLGRAYRVPGERTNTGVRYVQALVKAGRRDEARAVVAADPKLQGHARLEGVLDADR